MNKNTLNIYNISPIPKIFHKIWTRASSTNDEDREKEKNNFQILKSAHPNWIFIEWDDQKILDFIATYYQELLKGNVNFQDPIIRYDYGCYLILKHFGGAIIRKGFIFNKNIEIFLREYEFVLLEGESFINENNDIDYSFIATIPNHPFLYQFVRAFMRLNMSKNFYNPNKISTLAKPSIMFSYAIKKYISFSNDKLVKIFNNKSLKSFFYEEKESDNISAINIFSKEKQQLMNSSINNEELFIAPHPINALYDNLFVVSLKRSPERWTKIALTLYKMGVKFERFEAVDGYKIKITDPKTGVTFRGIDVKNKVYSLELGKYYNIYCDNYLISPIKITLKSDERSSLMAGNIGVWCSKVLFREEIIKNKYKNTIYLEDDFQPAQLDFLNNLNRSVKDIPDDYDIGYLSFYINKGSLNSLENSTYSVSDNQTDWWGDWLHMLSFQGAKKLNSDYIYVGNSDLYPGKLIKGTTKKKDVDNFKGYFSNLNFSQIDSNDYRGASPGSISSKMGCRRHIKEENRDCNHKDVFPNQIYIIYQSNQSKELTSLLNNLEEQQVNFITFQSFNSSNIHIINLGNSYNDEIALNKFAPSISDKNYDVICRLDDYAEIRFLYKIYNEEVIYEDLVSKCNQIAIFKDALRNIHSRILILPEDIIINENFRSNLDESSKSLPSTFECVLVIDSNFTSLEIFQEYLSGNNVDQAMLYSYIAAEKFLQYYSVY